MGRYRLSQHVATHRSWVFETDAPLDAFRYWFHRLLGEAGWTLEDADVYDHRAHGPDGTAYLRLTYHDDGIRLYAKIRTGLLRGSTADVADDLVDAGRRTQELVRQDDPPEAGAEEPKG